MRCSLLTFPRLAFQARRVLAGEGGVRRAEAEPRRPPRRRRGVRPRLQELPALRPRRLQELPQEVQEDRHSHMMCPIQLIYSLVELPCCI